MECYLGCALHSSLFMLLETDVCDKNSALIGVAILPSSSEISVHIYMFVQHFWVVFGGVLRVRKLSKNASVSADHCVNGYVYCIHVQYQPGAL